MQTNQDLSQFSNWCQLDFKLGQIGFSLVGLWVPYHLCLFVFVLTSNNQTLQSLLRSDSLLGVLNMTYSRPLFRATNTVIQLHIAKDTSTFKMYYDKFYERMKKSKMS